MRVPLLAASRYLSFLPAVWGDDQIIALGRRLLDGAMEQGFDHARVALTRQQTGS